MTTQNINFGIIGDDVKLAENIRLESHVVIEGNTFIDSETHTKLLGRIFGESELTSGSYWPGFY